MDDTFYYSELKDKFPDIKDEEIIVMRPMIAKLVRK